MTTTGVLAMGQIASILLVILTAFRLSRMLVEQKDATIQTLETENAQLRRQLEVAPSSGVLEKVLAERVERLEKELVRAKQEGEGTSSELRQKSDELRQAQDRLAQLEEAVRDGRQYVTDAYFEEVLWPECRLRSQREHDIALHPEKQTQEGAWQLAESRARELGLHHEFLAWWTRRSNRGA